MTEFQRFRADGKPNNELQETYSALDWSKLRSANGYVPEQAMADAINVALFLGQPLLITGEAGTGKTILASAIADQLKLAPPLKFETKSTSESRDLFYTYHSLSHFQASQTPHSGFEAIDFIDFNALGTAILRADPIYETSTPLPPERKNAVQERIGIAPTGEQSVVLIDEIDKAPRDFPNDILNEIELLSFRLPEYHNLRISASAQRRPIVVLTSNSEKNLPDAFLRRCVFYHIPFPTYERLMEIVSTRLAGLELPVDSARLREAIDFFMFLRRDDAQLEKKPSTAELLNWLIILTKLGHVLTQMPSAEALPLISCALLKTVNDQAKSAALLDRWKREKLGN